MQTKRQIEQLLASAGVCPNKRLGQHFLIDLNLMRLLVESANITGDDVVLEVGCGTGSLTEALAEKAGRTIAVEFDRNLSAIAQSRLAQIENVELINTDVLESKHTLSGTILNALSRARKEYPGRFLLVANLPYNIASPVMINLVTGPTIADGMYVTIQKEVAQRMTAGPASHDYGTLSIYLHATGDSQIIRTLKPTVFWPPPQVDSAMVGFVRSREKYDRIANMALFTKTVHLFMGHRRKTLLACTKLARERLAGIANWPEIFERCGIEPTKRPEQLAAKDYIAIANHAANS
ncbi:MAG TPA: 16S rRNA (adenine(1518)-N(6)/adenine(1519)-N(6))-dimethyltransferase RsmA [Sedimentisphaerales bacterium]|nr:16S rRNA (adenine(1518)-N(6)/adenine(1519)-N(6))-dimethyltransferase RsmA [Sedimentisphaerales bacterium]